MFVKNKFPLDKLITEAVSDSKPLFHEVMPAGTNANQRTEIYLFTDIMDDLKIAIAGVGTVGNGVLILLKKRKN